MLFNNGKGLYGIQQPDTREWAPQQQRPNGKGNTETKANSRQRID
jgi:hypothetical protein